MTTAAPTTVGTSETGRGLATGFTVVAVDSSQPDINEGHVGRARYTWIREQFDEPEDVKIFAIHHHFVSIPGTGRERNIITDAGDLLAELTLLDIDIVLSGHKHVPFFWGVNGMLICNSGTATTRRLSGSPRQRSIERGRCRLRRKPVGRKQAGPCNEVRSPEAPRLARLARWWVADSGRNLSTGPVTNI
jgi:3',5'-cyclic AMP phosphodiesterase CpdA